MKDEEDVVEWATVVPRSSWAMKTRISGRYKKLYEFLMAMTENGQPVFDPRSTMSFVIALAKFEGKYIEKDHL